MNNKEVLGNTEAQNENASEWTNQDFPEFNSAEKQEQEQVDIDKLAQDLVKARKDMREGATWDKEQRAYIGEDGLPRDWAHLVGYLKRNPDAIKTATETLAQLQAEDAPAETSAEEPALETEEASVEIEEDTTETEEAGAEIEENSTEIEEDNSEIEEDAAEIEEDDIELSEQSRELLNVYKDIYSKGGGSPSGIMENLRKRQGIILNGASERVQKAFTLDESKRELDATQSELNDAHAKYDSMPRLTLPWTKRGREKRSLLKTIQQKETLADSLADKISSYEEDFAEEPLSKKERATVRAIEAIPEYILQGSEANRKRLQAKLDLLDEAEKQLELPEEKRDWDIIKQVEIHAELFGDESVRARIAKIRENIAYLLSEDDKAYASLREEQKKAA